MTVETAEGPRLDKIQIRRQIPESMEEQDELVEDAATAHGELEAIAPSTETSAPEGQSEPRENFTRISSDTEYP